MSELRELKTSLRLASTLPVNPRVKGLFIQARGAIEDLQQQLEEANKKLEADNWINVDDELPKKHSGGFSQWVLVAFDCDGWSYVTKDKYDFDSHSWMDTDNATHWQPLPKPPKGEGL